MADSLGSILTELKNIKFVLFKKADVISFIKREAEVLSEDELGALFEDIFAFNAYLGRADEYSGIEKVPFWEYSVCLKWCESHIMAGDTYHLTLRNARRFLGNLRKYYEYLAKLGKLADSSQLERAIKEICGGRKLNLVQVIPYTGSESYTSVGNGKVMIDFDIADYWLLVLLDIQFDGNWTTLLEAAFGISGERVQKVRDLQDKMGKAEMEGLNDFICNDVQPSDVEQAIAWFYQESKSP